MKKLKLEDLQAVSIPLIMEFHIGFIFPFLERNGYDIVMYDTLYPTEHNGVSVNRPHCAILAVKKGTEPVGRGDSPAIVDADLSTVFLREVKERMNL